MDQLLISGEKKSKKSDKLSDHAIQSREICFQVQGNLQLQCSPISLSPALVFGGA